MRTGNHSGQLVITKETSYYVNGKVDVPPSIWIVECNDECSCSRFCGNKVVQHGSRVQLEIMNCGPKGWGVRAVNAIEKGAFVIEYIGELIESEVAEQRGRQYDAIRCSTLYDLDAANLENKYTLDASYHCSVARFINHSCNPNLANYQVLTDHHDIDRPHICFFASRNILPGEELSFDYRYPNVKRTLRCHCGEPTCRKWLV
eukprot:c20698_g1_i1.p1 GENE.c20698_g1_i1~~c20698_g1_i1.p1  ORF type:complete len:203 (+),score=30.26 c20698_g1_i1:2-610(+)